jgi:hypothetical protein
VQWGVAADDSNIYVALSDVRSGVAKPGTPGAQPYHANPKTALLLNSKAGGGLSALKLDTGEEVWRTPHPGCGDVPGCSPAQSAAVTAIPGLVFSGGLDGHLRAYFADNGKIAWDQDTKGDYKAVNGVAAKGGSIDGGGAIVVDGVVMSDRGQDLLEPFPATSCSPTRSTDCSASCCGRFQLIIHDRLLLRLSLCGWSPPSDVTGDQVGADVRFRPPVHPDS